MEEEGDILNRTVLVRGFEGNERDLVRAIGTFGSIVDITLHAFTDRATRPHYDVAGFIGKGATERGSNRIVDPEGAESMPGDMSRVPVHQPSLIWTVDLPGEEQTVDEFPRVDPRAKEKALQCCESVVLKRLSNEALRQLAQASFVVKALPGQELFVQGDTVKYVFVLVSGVVRLFARFPMEMRACEGLFEDEVIVGPVSGIGQPLGETDFLR